MKNIVVHIVVWTVILKNEAEKKKKKRSATSIEGEEVANMNERTKVNATVLGTVH